MLVGLVSMLMAFAVLADIYRFYAKDAPLGTKAEKKEEARAEKKEETRAEKKGETRKSIEHTH